MLLGTIDISGDKLLLSGLVSSHVQTCRFEWSSWDLVGLGVAATVEELANVLTFQWIASDVMRLSNIQDARRDRGRDDS